MRAETEHATSMQGSDERRSAAIVADRLTFAYPGQPPIFQGLTWRVAPGERWAVIGPSGCGKSTLLYLLAGLRRPTGGQVIINGVPVTRPRATVGLVLQDYGLLPWATVWENVALGMRLGRFYARKAVDDEARPYPPPDIPPERVDYWLERLGIAHLRDAYPSQLSGGQRQRTAIARTLVLSPSVLLMDEPFSSLDALTREDLQSLVLELTAEMALTMVLVTHSIEEAALLGRRILVLGRPPITQPTIVENPGAGDAAYRGQPEYWQTCAALRAALAGG